MSEVDKRAIKAELHKVIVDTILSYGGTSTDDAELYGYVISLCTNELIRMC
jgi:hypothetical protein